MARIYPPPIDTYNKKEIDFTKGFNYAGIFLIISIVMFGTVMIFTSVKNIQLLESNLIESSEVIIELE